MKTKYFIFSFIISLFCFSSVVSADTYNAPLNDYYREFDNYIDDVNDNSSDLSRIIEYYNQNLSSSCSYFFIVNHGAIDYPHPYRLYCSSSSLTFDIRHYRSDYNSQIIENVTWYSSLSSDVYVITINGNNVISSSLYMSSGNVFQLGIYSSLAANYFPFISSNIPLIINDVYDTYNEIKTGTSFTFPYFTSSNSEVTLQSFTITNGDRWPTYDELYDGSYTPSVSYTEVNLNNYAYIALSLKNYNVTEPFDTTFMVQGQLCLTPVYNYGMKEKTDFYSGYQVDRCSPVYDTFTPNRISILQQDIDNHAIYYLKAYDLNITNKVKIDTNIFDISYISSENSNKPSVIINGRSYPTIPYNNLSSSATISEEEGYISGESKNVFDISSDSSFITNLFSNPLQTLGNVWTSIISMFALVGTFISLLPNTLQVFLIAGFSIAIVLGILKILL